MSGDVVNAHSVIHEYDTAEATGPISSSNSVTNTLDKNVQDRTISASTAHRLHFSDIYSRDSTGALSRETNESKNVSPKTACAKSSTLDPNIQYDFSKLIIRNVSDSLPTEHIILYVEKLTGEIEVETIYRSLELKETVLFQLVEELDPKTVLTMHKDRPDIFGVSTEVIFVEEPRTLMVSGYGPDVNKDYLELYFTNRKRSFSNNLLNVEMFEEDNYALVHFTNPENLLPVLSQIHVANGQTLRCARYYNYIGDEPFDPATFPPKPIVLSMTNDARIRLLFKPSQTADRFRSFLFANDSDILTGESEFVIRCANPAKFTNRQLRAEWSELIRAKLDEVLSEVEVQSIELDRTLPAEQLDGIVKVVATNNEGAIVMKPKTIEIAADPGSIGELYDCVHKLAYPHDYVARAVAEVKGHHIDLLVNVLNLAQKAFQSLSIQVDKKNFRVIITGDECEVNACKEYFKNIVKRCVRHHHEIIPDIASFLLNEDSLSLIRRKLIKNGLVGSIYICERNQTRLTICAPSDDQAKKIFKALRTLITCKTVSAKYKNCNIFTSSVWETYYAKLCKNSSSFDDCHVVTKVIKGWYILLVGLRSCINKLIDKIKSFMKEQKCEYVE